MNLCHNVICTTQLYITMQAVFEKQRFGLEDYVENLRLQADVYAERYHQLAAERDQLWQWMRANETLPHPNGLWVIDVRVGGVSPAYDDALDRYDAMEEEMAVSSTVYWEMMVVVDTWAADQAA